MEDESIQLSESSSKPIRKSSEGSEDREILPVSPGRKLILSSASLKLVREHWGSQLEFLLSTIALTIGPGNLWRFPYICQKYGGGAFIFCYTICYVVLGFPLIILESAVGQYFQASILSLWGICPLLKGIGFHAFFIAFWTSSYHIVILAWVSFFMAASVTFEDLPWEFCNHTWNTVRCESVHGHKSASSNGSSSVDEFWKFSVTRMSDNMTEFGEPQWYLFVLLIFLWVFVYFSVFRGIKILGKILSIIVIFTCFSIFILLIRSILLQGAGSGISYLFQPKFKVLLKSEFKQLDFLTVFHLNLPNQQSFTIVDLITTMIWYEACSQVFYSLSIGFGTVITYFSYTDFHTDIVKINTIIMISDFLMSLILAAIVYSVLGSYATDAEFDIEEGQDLVFRIYPHAVAFLPAASLWSFVFFTGGLLLGFTSQIGLVQTMISALEDEFLICSRHRWFTIFLVCFIQFGVSVLLITRAGVYYIRFFDEYVSSGWSIFSQVLLESLGISYIFGAEKLVNKITDMIGYPFPKCFKYWWWYIIPCILGTLLCFITYHFSFLGHEPGYRWWIDIFALLMTTSAVIFVPGYMVIRLLREKGSWKERIKKSVTPESLAYT